MILFLARFVPEGNHIALVEVVSNPVDDIWIENRPEYNSQPLYFIDGGKEVGTWNVWNLQMYSEGIADDSGR